MSHKFLIMGYLETYNNHNGCLVGNELYFPQREKWQYLDIKAEVISKNGGNYLKSDFMNFSWNRGKLSNVLIQRWRKGFR